MKVQSKGGRWKESWVKKLKTKLQQENISKLWTWRAYFSVNILPFVPSYWGFCPRNMTIYTHHNLHQNYHFFLPHFPFLSDDQLILSKAHKLRLRLGNNIPVNTLLFPDKINNRSWRAQEYPDIGLIRRQWKVKQAVQTVFSSQRSIYITTLSY